MLIRLILIFGLGFLAKPLFIQLLPWSQKAQKLCQWATPQSPYTHQYKQMVCGIKNTDQNISKLFKKMGMFHILIISGAHLIFLNKLLVLLSLNRATVGVRLLLLFLFVFQTQFQITALRAWIFLVFNFFNKKLKLFIKPTELIFLSVLFCLTISPNQYHSFSLILSWLACLGIYWGRSSISQAFTMWRSTCETSWAAKRSTRGRSRSLRPLRSCSPIRVPAPEVQHS